MKIILQLNKLNKPKELISTFLFYLSILFFIISFNFSDTPLNSGWVQQFMPSGLPNFQISDIFFLDSLTGWAVTGNSSPNDSSGYILKTTNGGDNWTLKFAEYRDFSRVKFINATTGFVSGGYFNGAKLYKTINGGNNWSNIYNLMHIYLSDMSVLNEDTIWVTNPNDLEGGVFRTTNGGASWQPQYSQIGANPSHIYMYNARLGFMDGGGLKRTTDGGASWTPIPGEGLFFDMYFTDSLTGWKCNQLMKKTTDGGLSWINQILPSGGNILVNYMLKFSNVNIDTVWGVGGQVFYGAGQFRGMIFRTTNGGTNWLFQVPDTAIHISTYTQTDFVNKLNGWAYTSIPTGIHTTTGGNDTFYTSVQQINTKVPDNFYLGQNYPNPFNPKSNIKYQIAKSSYVILRVYDIQGREIEVLVNQKQNAGFYETTFDGSDYSSGIYFYSLIADGKLIETRKMILLK